MLLNGVSLELPCTGLAGSAVVTIVLVLWYPLCWPKGQHLLSWCDGFFWDGMSNSNVDMIVFTMS